jgi:hypothetical protein
MQEYGFLGCNPVYLKKWPTFRRDILPPYLGSKSNQNKKQAAMGRLTFFWFTESEESFLVPTADLGQRYCDVLPRSLKAGISEAALGERLPHNEPRQHNWLEAFPLQPN